MSAMRHAESKRIQRRTFLHAGALPFLGLGLADWLCLQQEAKAAPAAPRGKSCIMLFLTGGPAQQDTFDLKPDGPEATRGEFKPIATNVPGIEICEHLPLLAKQAHRYALLRSCWHNSDTHGVGVHYNLTGLLHAPGRPGEPQLSRRDPPGLGGVVRQLRGDRNGLPGAVQLPRPVGDQNNQAWAGQGAGYLGPRFDPLFLHDEKWMPGDPLPGFVPAADMSPERQSGRTNLLNAVQKQHAGDTTPQRTFEQFQQQALDVLRSGPAWKAFRIDEKPAMVERYGKNRFGRSCLVARRLIEAGVGVVTVPWMNKQSEQNFDTHSKNFSKLKTMLLPPVDQALSALLEDLAERGLLGDTLVAVTGEFGRTPKVNGSGGRDHWGRVYSTLLAGAGIKGGQVYGKSDKQGGTPADSPVHASDLFATMYQALGYGPDTKVYDQTGRPHFIVQGRAIPTLF
jgi:hypothetical protein